MQVLLEVRDSIEMPDTSAFEDLVEFAMKKLEVPANSEVSVTFVGIEEIAALNLEYRGIEGPTDVLSFECDNLEDEFPSVNGEEEVYSLGDIIIAPAIAAKQAVEYGNTIQDEISLLLVHGILHLNGYDHIDDADAEVMEAKQLEILNAWNEEASQ